MSKNDKYTQKAAEILCEGINYLKFKLLLEDLNINFEKAAKSYLEVLSHFSGDPEITWTWFTTSNPYLGSWTPLQLILLGKEDKLLTFIENAKDGGNW